MSIATEITRLQNAKASIKTSIENKGVTVPSATKLDGYSALIDSIETGGGSGEWTTEGIAQNLEPNGDIFLDSSVNALGSYSFAYKPITSVTVNGAFASTNSYVFYQCKNLASVNMPNVTRLGGNWFDSCTALKTLHLPSVEIMNTYNFRSSGIEVIVLPKLNSTAQGWQVFAQATNLLKVDIYGTTIPQQCFSGSSKVDTIILRNPTICGLNNINAFTNTPFASGKSGGTLYVPQSLISSYQSATNWSTILGYTNNQIKSIESTHTDPTAPIDLTLYYADGTPIS